MDARRDARTLRVVSWNVNGLRAALELTRHIAAAAPRTELTIRGLVLGVVITVLFTAANVFFGLKAGLTFATSIPAAVISMALLRAFKDSTIQENNIVQTVASAYVYVDVTDREDPYVTAARFVLLDYTGEEIAQTLLSSWMICA